MAAKRARKFTRADVMHIRESVIEGGTSIDYLAKEWGTSRTRIIRTLTGERYSNYPGPTVESIHDLILVDDDGNAQGLLPFKSYQTDLTAMPVFEVARLLQALQHEWPKVKAAFDTIDKIIRGDDD